MLNGFKGFVYGWIATLRIKFFEPEVYKILTDPFDIEDFGEVEEPKCTHKDTYVLLYGEVVCRECGEWTGEIII